MATQKNIDFDFTSVFELVAWLSCIQNVLVYCLCYIIGRWTWLGNAWRRYGIGRCAAATMSALGVCAAILVGILIQTSWQDGVISAAA